LQTSTSISDLPNPELVMTRALTNLLALLLVSFTAAVAQAKSRVTIHEFFGPHASALRAEAEHTLKHQHDVQVISKDEVDAAAHNLGVDVLSPAGRKTMSRELGLSAWVTGIVRKHGKGLRLTVVVYDGAEHASVGRTVLDAGSPKMLQGAVKQKLWLKAKEAIMLALAPLPSGRGPIEEPPLPEGRAPIESSPEATPSDLPVTPTPPVAELAPPARAEPKHDPRGSAPAPEASSSPSSPIYHRDAASASPGRSRSEALRAALAVGSPYRKLSYNDPYSSSLGDYQLAGMPMLDLSIAYYPARSFTQGWASWLGLDLAGQFSLGGGASADREGNEFRARYDAYRFGARVRAPVQKHFVSAFSGYTMQRLSFSSDSQGQDAPTPDIDYRMIRTGAGSELRLTEVLGLALEAAWLHVLSVGEIGKWFPRATAGAFELGIQLSYALGHHMFARLGASYQRMAFDFHARPGDRKIAGGATDQLLTASLGIGVGI
jgi:hypothetical protein